MPHITAFEAAIIADYDAETAVERELVLRLASLLWRLRRATSIETDLLRMQAEILRKRRQRQERGQLERPQTMQLSALEPSIQPRFSDASMDDHPNDPSQSEDRCNRAFDAHPVNSSLRMAPPKLTPRDLAHCFQRLVN